MDNRKKTFNLFVLSLIASAGVIASPFSLGTFLNLWWGTALTADSANQAIIVASVVATLVIATLNMAMICLAWRWEGRGEPVKGIKALGWLLIGEFTIFVVVPRILGLSIR